MNKISGGNTMHSGLELNFGKQYLPLNPERLEKLRKEFENNLPYDYIIGQSWNLTGMQMMTWEIHGTVQVFLVYLSQGKVPKEKMLKYLKKSWKEEKYQIIFGDFNDKPEDCGCLKDFFAEKGLQQLINYPTHEAGNLIDHCYIHPLLIDRVEVKITCPYYTDHAAILLNIK